MQKQRVYHYPDVNMLLACETICNTLQKNIGDLSVIQPQWSNEYVSDLHERIDYCIDHYLAIDPEKKLRHAAALFMSIQEPALRDVYFLKKQLETSFKEDKNLLNDILMLLGYDSYLDETFEKDPKALIHLLATFKSGLSDSIRKMIIDKGMSPLLIERILGFYEDLKFKDMVFDAGEATEKEVSAEALQVFNSIYNEVIDICKLASCYYHFDTLKKDQFSFHKVVGKQVIQKYFSSGIN
ncbi:MAG: hypothetical protein JEZ14_16040 [Marinilabiliaceae bacterium]|nr:hypothetical protein [Marinilabiliaceae bacterium]